MQLNLGQKIRELRQRDERTQEMLADALGVTSQAVSRWESNGGYPDMEFIPAIANYFHISIDELFGYSADRESKIEDILHKTDALLRRNGLSLKEGDPTEEFETCIETLRTALAEFPNEPRFLSRLAEALFYVGWKKHGARAKLEDGAIVEDAEHNAKNVYWREALQVSEKLINVSTTEEDRENAIYRSIYLHGRLGEYEKAKQLACKQHSVRISREMLLPLAANGTEKAHYQGLRILSLISNLGDAVQDAIYRQPELYSSAYCLQVFESVLGLYETVFSDGRCGHWHFDISMLCFQISYHAEKFCKDRDKALIYFDKGFDHFTAYKKVMQEDCVYTAPLVAHLKYSYSNRKQPHPVASDYLQTKLEGYSEEFLAELRKNEKYAECFV